MTDSAEQNDVWTVQRILDWTTQFLAGKGIEPARREAEHLLAYSRQCQRIHLYADFQAALSDAERARMRECVKRRANYEPLAYITGHKEFYGREFEVGQGVLVPRPETETLIDVCLELIPDQQSARIAEIGFGSGCISITLARQRSEIVLAASDISEAAMQYATKNISNHDVASQVELHHGSGLAPLADFVKAGLDGIVSNPPYIRDDEFSTLSPDVAQHEARTALTSGEDGLDLIRTLIPAAFTSLNAGGWLALEFDPAQSEPVAELMKQSGFIQIHVTKDLRQQDRTISGRKPE